MRQFLITLMIATVAILIAPDMQGAKRYDVTFRDAPVENVISDLRKRTGYDFVYQKDVLTGSPKISGHYKGMTLEQMLSRIFQEELNVDYEIVDKTVILTKGKEELPYYKRNLSGMVVDEAGEPLPGVTVYIEGTNIGTATDLDGQFTLIVEGKHPRLKVSYMGMKTQTVALQPKQRNVVITMQEDVQMMAEMIVTGYSNFKRESATGAYQTITAADLDQRHVGTITENLEGKIPGLLTYDNGKGSQMTIRGTGSFEASNNPLVVVDGLPIEGGIETVNPYDIENITVLKDAAAAAIYGARASSGVIVITTKRAKGDKTQVDFNTDVTFYERNNHRYLGYATAAEMVELEGYNFNYIKDSADRAAYNSLLNYYNTGRTYGISPATLLHLRGHLGAISETEMKAGLDRLAGNDYYRQWQRIIETPRANQQYNLAVRHNSKSLTSNLTVNYERDNNGGHDGYGSTLMFGYNGTWNVIPRLDVNFGVNLISERAKLQIQDSEYGYMTAYLPYYDMYNPDGTPAGMQGYINLDNPVLSDSRFGFKSAAYNPLTDHGLATQRERRTNIRSYVNATLKLLPGWDASAMFQYEDIYYKGDTYWQEESFKMRSMYNHYTTYDKGSGSVSHHIPNGGMLNTTTSEGSYYTFRAQTNYENTLAEKHDINAAAGFEFREQRTKTYGNVLMGYDDQTQTNANSMINWGTLKDIQGTASAMGSDHAIFGAPDGSESFTTGDVLHRFYSVYFTGNYVYDTKYALTGSFRIDKADLFGADPKFRGRPLWSVGASWNMHNEKFLQDVVWINALKLRASYGLTGNIANNVSSYLTGTIGINDIYGNKYVTLDTPPNDQLRWEKTATWNFGADFALFNSRLTGALDYYVKNGSDLLTVTDLDPTTGWSQLTINNGKVRNTGVEFMVNGTILQARSRDEVNLSLGGTLAFNHNKVTRVSHSPATGTEALASYTLHEGYPVNSLFSYDFAGMVSEGNMQYYSWRDAQGNVHTTDINTEDFTVDDIVYSGSLDPKVMASLSPTARWKGFSLSAMLSYYGGHVMRADCNEWTSDGSAYGYGSLAEIDAVPASYLNYWRFGNEYPANGYLGGSHVIGDGRLGNQNVVPADYMKVRNIVLGYSFSDRVCKTLRMEDLRLRFQINNLATWARNDRGIDPEANNALNGERILKTPRSYTFSLFFSF